MIGHTIKKKYRGKPAMSTSDTSGVTIQNVTAHFHCGSGSSRAESIARYGVNATASIPITGTVASASATIPSRTSSTRSRSGP